MSSKLEDDSKGEEDVVKVDLPSLFEETRELSSRDDVGLDRLVDDWEDVSVSATSSRKVAEVDESNVTADDDEEADEESGLEDDDEE